MINRLPQSQTLIGWVSVSGLDAIGRIVLQVIATVMLARWLSPEIFGEASLTVVVVGVLTIFATAPFEEALTQRKVVRRQHFSSSLAVVLGISSCAWLLAGLAWCVIDFSGEAAIVAPLVALFSVVVFAEAIISIYTAIARRHKAFNRIAWSNLVGHLAGTVVGLALALAGVGVWSLLAIRLVGRFSTMLLLVSASPVRIFPRFSLPHLRELSGFAGWSFGSRVVDTITDAVFQALVTRFFGLVGVGYLNMALRIIEPVRGATGSIGHNIAMSFFVRAQDAPKKLRNLVSQTITGTAIVMLPIFIGLAAAGPSIIEVIAGPDWQPSAVLVVLLALGAAITCSTNFHHTGLVAKGRAELAFISSVLEFSVMVCALWLLSGWGLVAAGVARFVAFAVDANYAVLVARKVLNIRARTTVRLILPLFVTTSVMGGLVYSLDYFAVLAAWPLPQLLLQIAVGVAFYGILLGVFHRRQLATMISQLRPAEAEIAVLD